MIESGEIALWREILTALENVIASAGDEADSRKSCRALRDLLVRYRVIGPFPGIHAPRPAGLLADKIVFRLEDTFHVHGDNPPFVNAIEAELPKVREVLQELDREL